jgi:hypothetical protein
MKTSEMKAAAETAGLDWKALKAIYDEMREHDRGAIERPSEMRRIAFAALGHGHGGRWKMANRHATTDGDMSNVRHFDDVARQLAATELPELGADDPAAELWALVTGDAPELPPAAETFERALDRAKLEAPRAPVSPDDLLSLPLAAYAADISEQWLRQLVKDGRVAGFRVGRCWLVKRSAAESFKRHPTAGRPRKEAAPF